MISSKVQERSKLPPCVLCKSNHVLRNCAVFKEKNATQRAKYVAELKLCFACLNGNHSFLQCLDAKKVHSHFAIAHMSYSMEPKTYLLGRKVRMPQIRLENTSPRKIQTTLPKPLLVIYMTLNRLKGCCQLQHLVWAQM